LDDHLASLLYQDFLTDLRWLFQEVPKYFQAGLVEAKVVDRVLALLPPSDAAAGLAVEIPIHAGDAVGQGQSHTRVVGLFARGRTVGTARSITCLGLSPYREVQG